MRVVATSTIALFLTACAGLTAVKGVAPPPDHPILGKWRFDLPGNGCLEVYDFLPNGTRRYVASEEAGESAYEVSATQLPSGFYSIKDTITKSNGKLDCSGGTAPIGHEVTIFIRFHPSGQKLIMCQEESLESCFGLFVRLPDSDP